MPSKPEHVVQWVIRAVSTDERPHSAISEPIVPFHIVFYGIKGLPNQLQTLDALTHVITQFLDIHEYQLCVCCSCGNKVQFHVMNVNVRNCVQILNKHNEIYTRKSLPRSSE